MTLLTSLTVGVVFASAIYLMLGRELKGVCMGVFLLGHGANLAILANSRSPIGRLPPVLGESGTLSGLEADPLPQALILTAIVISFAVQAFLLTLLVLTHRRSGSLELDALQAAESSAMHTDAGRTDDTVNVPDAHVGVPDAHVGVPDAHVGVPDAHVGVSVTTRHPEGSH